MKTYARPAILALAALGLVASILSLYVHYQLHRNPAYTSFCDVSETVSCEAVLQSRYASVWGVPVAAGGAIWSALILLLAWRGMAASKSDSAAASASYIFLLSTIGLAAVLYFGYTSFFVLQKMCLLCLTMYVSVAGIFIVSSIAGSVSLASMPGRAARDVQGLMRSPAAAAVAIAWLVGSVSLVAFFPRAQEPEAAVATAAAPPAPTETLQGEELAQFEQWLGQQPRVDLPIPRDGAAVLVLKFNDYQCPACRQTYLEYKWIREKYRQAAVKFVSVDFPLESECNLGSVHPSACEAAAAVRMAHDKNRGEAMEEWLFANQSKMTLDVVKQGLREVAGVTDFDAQYSRRLEQVRADAKLGRDLDITGTPTFFINGIKFNTSLRPSYFDAAIQYELKKASGPKPQASEGSGQS
jgi:uncharacterized membrane protein/protein-disulfide isomerase